MIEWLTNPQTWIALLTLTSLEIVLGVDNVIFVSILAGQAAARRSGPRARRAGPVPRDVHAHRAAVLV